MRGAGLIARILAALALLVLVALAPARAVQPDEVLADPALEARARALSAELRCMVCQNQSIDDSDAELARDLRVLVRERLSAGDSDGQVIDYLVGRYGEFVLLRPRLSWQNALLWAGPVLLLGVGGIAVWRLLRTRARPVADARDAAPPLSGAELQRLERLLREP